MGSIQGVQFKRCYLVSAYLMMATAEIRILKMVNDLVIMMDIRNEQKVLLFRIYQNASASAVFFRVIGKFNLNYQINCYVIFGGSLKRSTFCSHCYWCIHLVLTLLLQNNFVD